MRFRFLSAVAVAVLTFPAAAAAVGSTTDVSGTVGSELSVVATDPLPMTFSPSIDGVAASTVTVTSTQPSWSLTIHDAGATTPGHMDKVNCATRALLTGSLANALAWAAPGPGTSGSLSGSGAAVKSNGSLVDSVVVNFTQGIGAAEDVALGDCYQLTVTWTVT